MNKIYQFFYRSFVLLLLSFPMFLSAQNRNTVKADLIGVDRRMMAADSLDQPQKAIELAQSLYSLALKTGNTGLQYKALNYELRNQNRLNPVERNLHLNEFLDKAEMIKSDDYKAIGILFYLNETRVGYRNREDSVQIKKINSLSKDLLKLLPQCKEFITADYNGILGVNSITRMIAPTLNLYLSAAWITRFKNDNMMNQDLFNQFIAELTNSGEPAASMWGEYMSNRSYQRNATEIERIKALIAKYKNIPEVGFLYDQFYFNQNIKEEITSLEEYISRYPNTAYATKFRNDIANLKATSLTVTFPSQYPLKEKAPLSISKYQANGLELTLTQNKDNKRIFFPLAITPDYKTDTVCELLPPLKAGVWQVSIDSAKRSANLYISNIANYQIGNNIYGVDFITGKPLSDAFVSFSDNIRKVELKMNNGILDAGILKDKVKDRFYWTYQLKKKNQLSVPGSIYINEPENNSIPELIDSKIIINKPIYRLGDSVQFKGWTWKSSPFNLTLPPVQTMTVRLRDPNYKAIDSVTVSLNKFGSFDGNMLIPAIGMNGYYQIETEYQFDNNTQIIRQPVQVEAYQAPAFKVNLSSSQKQYDFADSALITGNVISFNGLPVANQEVRYNATFIYLLRFIYPGYNYNLNGSTKTDDKGNFSFNIPLSGVIKDKIYAIRSLISATITNESGETQKGICSFIIADKPYNLTIKGSNFLDISDSDATYEITAQTPVKGSVKSAGLWRLENRKGNIMKSGKWSAGDKLKLNLPAGFIVGEYKLICESDDGIKAQKDIVVFNSMSREMPVDTTLLLIPGKNNTLYIGTSEKEIHIRSIWKLGNKPTVEKWVKLNKGIQSWPLPVVDKGYNALLTLVTVKDRKIFKEEFRIDNPIVPDSINIAIKTFRDHLLPGANETWSLTLSKDREVLNSASTLAFMYDQALSSLSDYNPVFNLTRPTFNLSSYIKEGDCFGNERLFYRKNIVINNDTTYNGTNPYFGFKEYFNPQVYAQNNGLIIGAAPMAKGVSAEMRGDFLNETAEHSKMSNGGMDDSSVRSNFTDCAFFYPNLPVSNDGKVTFSFTLPDLITTWRFVAITNNEKMEVGQVQQSFVASKDLMLQINEPRFLRQGDKTEVEATVSFLKSHSGTTKVTMELVDATTEKTITSAEKQVSGNDQVLKVSFPLAVPVNTDRIILRMQASNGNFSDGEQYLIPVLSPDIELTQTMELNTGGNSDTKFQWKELNLNSLVKSNSEFRIELVKNPAWYTVNALSALLNPSSVSADALINAYFANTLGEAIARANPDIETYLIEKAKSPLSGKTDNTPWVNEEEQENKQIQQALLLYNPGQIEYLRSSAFAKLKQLQNEDGGFSWYPGMGSSVWQTLTVLQRMGELTELGVIEYGQTEKMMQIDALKYIDKFIADTYLNELKYKSTDKPLNSTQAQILYVRAMYMDIPLTGETLTGHKNWTSRASKSWIGNDLYTKSLLANALFAYGFTNDAKEIVTSILNYGVESPTLGFWFPSNQSDKLQTQVAMMRLMLNPQVNQPKRFEQMKWWLIAQKQNRMWPTTATTVDAVYALTMQGANVLNANGTLSVMLGSKELRSRDNMILSQNIPVPDLIAANGEICVVNQTPLPVFGALYRTFLTPVKSVKGNNKGALQIQKEMIRNGNESLKVGEEVTVRITVKSNQALDFVQIQDQLAACYQPVDQKSGYSWMQVACYKELTNENINFFIETLPRGTTVFEYKVWINRPGTYQSGVAKIESVYNPQFTNYSDNCELEVK